MMYCPECHSEFFQGVDLCPDCKVTLITQLPTEKKLEEIDWVPLHEFPSKTHADMAVEILIKHQISNYIKSELFSSALQLSGPSAIGNSAVIFVPKEQLDRAKQLLENIID